MTKVCCVSDLHGYLPEIPECDLLLIAGDVAPDDFVDVVPSDVSPLEYQEDWLFREFEPWLRSAPAKAIVGIAGNHDSALYKRGALGYELDWTYLRDEEVVLTHPAFGRPLKIWGSPYTPKFGNWPFMLSPGLLAEKWRTIPKDIDILMTHGPAYGVNDTTTYFLAPGEDPHVGCGALRRTLHYEDFPNLKLFVNGHIHEGYGQTPVKN
jgi:predicted phosphodiesterase